MIKTSTNRILFVLKKNISLLKANEQCEIIRGDAMQYFERTKQQFDIIFADPPYAFERTGEIPFLISEKKKC